MPEIRERKQGEKVKANVGTPATGTDLRQQMTAKFRRELAEKARNRQADDSETPEAEATEQAQSATLTVGREIVSHSADAISNTVRNNREREKAPERQRPEPSKSDAPKATTQPAHEAPPTPSARDRMPQRTTGSTTNQHTDSRSEHPAPKEHPAEDAARVRPVHNEADRAKPARPLPPTAGDRMRQTAVNDLRRKQIEGGHKAPVIPQGQVPQNYTASSEPPARTTTIKVFQPVPSAPTIHHEQPSQSFIPRNSPPPPPSPRERMRENTIREKKTQTAEIRERQNIPRVQENPSPRESFSPEAPLIKDTTQEINLPGGKQPEIPRAGHSERPTPDKSIAPEPPPTGQAPFPPPFRDATPAPSQPKKQMRQKAMKEKQKATRQRGPVQSGPKPAAPLRKSPPERISPYETQTPPGKRMLESYRSRRAKEVRQQPPPSVAPASERPSAPECPPAPATVSVPEKHSVSLEHQSVNPSVKERSRRGNSPKEKPAGGAFLPKTRQSTAIQTRSAKAATPTGKGAARQIRDKARQRVQRNAQRKMLQTSRKAAQVAGSLTKKAAAVTAKAAKALFTALAGLLGGGILLPVIIVIILVAAIIASPFGILFSNEPTPGATPLNIAVGQLNRDLSNTLEELQEGEYDEIDIEGQAPDWREVVAVFAAKTAGAEDGVDVAALTPDRLDRLTAVFWDMCQVSAEVEEIEHEDSDPDDEGDDSWTERILHIKIESKSADDMRTEYDFTALQSEALDELIDELATMELLVTDLTATEEQARELLENLPDDLAPERRAVVETACELVGKVTYFWGGKSLLIGWDDRWGRVTKVWAEGSTTTGTYRPYGLDCSGFADWTFYNATEGAYYPGHGGGTLSQLADSTQISWAEAQPGDLVFAADVSHVGIVGGWDPDGNLLIIHCTIGSINGVTISGTYGFGIVARPSYFTI